MAERKVNFSIADGQEFYAHEVSVHFNPLQFFIDFKSLTPRVDVRSNDAHIISLKHNLVMIEPYHAKQFSRLLLQVIKRYEKEFGKIEMPKQLQKVKQLKSKELQVANKENNEQIKPENPTYFG
ncbi:DUF3467 domain-containing protein [Candidatus Woesearchaeota archaeon]|nr:DUF3467 domain-containing protein [Candidatus Woesearchaeota archaeon]